MLVEVLVASLVVALTLTAFLITATASRRATVAGNDYLTALHHARAEMESLQALSYSDSELDLGTHTNLIWPGSYAISNNARFAATKDIYVTVVWTQAVSARVSSVTLVSAVTAALH